MELLVETSLYTPRPQGHEIYPCWLEDSSPSRYVNVGILFCRSCLNYKEGGGQVVPHLSCV